MTEANNPESGRLQYTYDNNSNLKTKSDNRTPSVTTTFDYDAMNRLITKTYSDTTPAVTYGYEKDQSGVVVENAVGRMTFVSTSVSTTSYSQYDELGRVLQSKQTTQASANRTYAMSYEYNLAGELIAETYPSLRKVATSYDAAGRISEVKDQNLNKSYASAISYAPQGAVSAMTLGNGLIEKTSFNSRMQPVQIKLGTSSSQSSVLQLDYTYESANQHDNNGNVLKQSIGFTGFNAQQTYTYDELNRIKSFTEQGGWNQTYSYDRFGNRWVSAGNIPNPQQTPQLPTHFDAATNKLNNQVLTNVQYDGAGNLLRDAAGGQYTYDAENRQLTSNVGGVAASYAYDGDGRRVRKTAGTQAVTTLFVYDVMGRLIAEYDDSTVVATSGGTKYLTVDHLGSTRVVTGQNQAVVARYDYLPFGEEIGAGAGGRTVGMGYGGSDSTRQRFNSKERDDESGLDYFLARYYSGAQGRFISPDEFTGGPDELFEFADQAADNPTFYANLFQPQSLNKYQYCYNNPLAYIDPDLPKKSSAASL